MGGTVCVNKVFPRFAACPVTAVSAKSTEAVGGKFEIRVADVRHTAVGEFQAGDPIGSSQRSVGHSIDGAANRNQEIVHILPGFGGGTQQSLGSQPRIYR